MKRGDWNKNFPTQGLNYAANVSHEKVCHSTWMKRDEVIRKQMTWVNKSDPEPGRAAGP